MPCRSVHRSDSPTSNAISRLVFLLTLCLSFQLTPTSSTLAQEQHAGTAPLTWDDDIASRMVAGADRFLLKRLQDSIDARAKHWSRNFESPKAYNESIEPNRQRLRYITGVRDSRRKFAAMELVATTESPSKVGQSPLFRAYAIRWPTLRDMHGEGLLLEPANPNGIDIVAIPDADQTPEQVSGLAPGLNDEQQFARRLAESGCRVVVPTLISRHRESRLGGANLTSREYVYRSAYELGRHLIGYELQQTFAAIDWFEKTRDGDSKIGVVGWGEGGMLALYAAALDTRIKAAVVSGYFDSRQTIWSQPIDRNVFGLLEQFGDAELASMVAPRTLIVDASPGPEMVIPGNGGAPAELVSPKLESVRAEHKRAVSLLRSNYPDSIQLLAGGDSASVAPKAIEAILKNLGGAMVKSGEPPKAAMEDVGAAQRQARLVHEMDDHNQWLLRESSYVRADFMKERLDTSSPERFAETSGKLRDFFRNEVIGSYGSDLLPFNARSRKIKETDKYVSYEVVLDVMPDVFAYGILIRPKGIQPDEKRPVVVCQHGLEGRPQDIVQGDHRAYHDFAAKLAERGFVTFSPQNIYIFKDRFRTLQRKSYPIKKTLFSIMVPQHQQIVNWLSKQDYVDPSRIAFYGLSYGGKSAMRIPPLVENYCLSICSADFNEWVWKNAATTRGRYTYVRTGEYEIFEFDLGSTFNYAEMATLIAPRPFMVERGHYDGVAPDEKVAHEFAKVRFLYQAKLKLLDRCEIEWFDGPHTINGKGTFDFLHKHLRWPKDGAR